MDDLESWNTAMILRFILLSFYTSLVLLDFEYRADKKSLLVLSGSWSYCSLSVLPCLGPASLAFANMSAFLGSVFYSIQIKKYYRNALKGPDCVKLDEKVVLCLPTAGRRTQFFHPTITQPGKSLLMHPCIDNIKLTSRPYDLKTG